MPGIVKICGKDYEVSARTTIAQDGALESVLDDHRLKEMEPANGETEEDFLGRVYLELIRSGAWKALLAARLNPVGEKWSVAGQALVVSQLDEVDDPDEKIAITQLVPWMVASFFARGLFSKSASLLSSSIAQGDGPEVLTLKIRLEPGARWFGHFLTSIRAGFKAFWTVLSTNPSPATTES